MGVDAGRRGWDAGSIRFGRESAHKEAHMTVPIVSQIAYGAIVVAAIAAFPIWPWSRDWGNGNAGALAYILLVVSINAGLGQIL
jgi:hypothetical protein